ncbi:hypothetical protein M422DRAFT_253621 [Sphaerobolus stellatus SS14]|uniref:DNase I-like protein n=1 Tax=Sphaerobolus stellatus (strain SS14) TaxID=990650 RepID=A0A0C9UJ57_SPHS4|nr:hypothetical protein M422DRAFT_253621 [Sphaerobolus stellatus SS14]
MPSKVLQGHPPLQLQTSSSSLLNDNSLLGQCRRTTEATIHHCPVQTRKIFGEAYKSPLLIFAVEDQTPLETNGAISGKSSELHRLEDTFSGRIQILSSIDNENPNSKGVAFLLNKQLTAWKEAQGIEIIPGRALLLCLPWHNDKTLNILTIYAPNASTENQTFWSDLHRKWQADGLPTIHMLLGDFNLVEDSIDRLPAHNDLHGPREALANFKSLFGLLDGWRRENPDIILHTWHQNQWDIHSRIDRIYSNELIYQNSCNWSITPPPILTDHDMVNVRIFKADIPYIALADGLFPSSSYKKGTL